MSTRTILPRSVLLRPRSAVSAPPKIHLRPAPDRYRHQFSSLIRHGCRSNSRQQARPPTFSGHPAPVSPAPCPGDPAHRPERSAVSALHNHSKRYSFMHCNSRFMRIICIRFNWQVKFGPIPYHISRKRPFSGLPTIRKTIVLRRVVVSPIPGIPDCTCPAVFAPFLRFPLRRAAPVSIPIQEPAFPPSFPAVSGPVLMICTPDLRNTRFSSHKKATRYVVYIYFT